MRSTLTWPCWLAPLFLTLPPSLPPSPSSPDPLSPLPLPSLPLHHAQSTEAAAKAGTPFGWPRDPKAFVRVIEEELAKGEDLTPLGALSGLLFLFLVEGDGDGDGGGDGENEKDAAETRRPGLSGAYDSRARAAFRAAASAFGVPWTDPAFVAATPPRSFCSAEAALARYTQIAAQGAKQASALGDGKASSGGGGGGGMTWGRGLAIGGAAVAGAGLLALTGG